ncbi:hypothetical protein FB639_005099, partial [Coemansia asiatica]
LWDLRTNRTVQAIGGFSIDEDSGITGAVFTGDHGLAVSCGRFIRVYDQRALKLVNKAHTDALASIDNGSDVQGLSARGDFVAHVDEEGMVGTFDSSESNPAIERIRGNHDALSSCVCISPSLPELATGGFDQRVLIWDMEKEILVREVDAGAVSGLSQPNEGNATNQKEQQLINPPFVYSLDYWNVEQDSGTRILVSGHADGSLMSICGDSEHFWTKCHDYSISALQFVRSKPECLVTAGLDRIIKVWDSESVLFPDSISATEDLKALDYFVLSAKADAIASSAIIPHIFTDSQSDIMVLTLE